MLLDPGNAECLNSNTDIDECDPEFGNFTCLPYQTCINTYGGYRCRCNPGFEDLCGPNRDGEPKLESVGSI